MPGPMHGVRVVELGIWVAAPSAGGVLADWGADVVKIESPQGDPLRAIQGVLGPDVDCNPYFDPDNRGKRSVVLDLWTPEGRRTALELIDGADVFLTNLRAAALERLGLDSATLLARDPRLVYAIVTGYGLTGPDAGAGAYDLGAYWARGGIADLLSAPDTGLPTQRSGMGDHVTGMTTAGMISAALFARQRSGEGQLVSTSLLRVATYQVSSDLNTKLMIDRDPVHNDRRTQDNPLWNHYRAGDGNSFWLIAAEPDRHWPALTRIVGRPDWEHDERYATRPARKENAVQLIAELDDIFATRPRGEWAALFDAEKDFFWAPVNTVDDVLADPQTAASGAFVETADGSLPHRMIATPADFHGTPASVRTRAPRLGEHTDEVLREIGLSDTEIERYREAGVTY